MNSYVKWMSNNKLVNVLLILIYFIAVVLPHKKFGTFLNDVVFTGITRDQYNLYVLMIAISVLVIYMIIFFKGTKHLGDRKKLWFYLASNIVFAAILIKYLFVINIEIVHFPQYAFFVLLMFPLVGNYTGTLIWTTGAGALDEAYQYFYLAPNETGYYDMNDVVTNLVGAVFGLLLLRALKVKEINRFSLTKSSIWVGLGILSSAIVIAYVGGWLSIYPSETTKFQLMSKMPKGFWSKVYPDVTYHIMRPLEGLIVTILLWLFYSRIGEQNV